MTQYEEEYEEYEYEDDDEDDDDPFNVYRPADASFLIVASFVLLIILLAYFIAE